MLPNSDPKVLSALLDAQHVHAPVTLMLNDGHQPTQSNLLGFDYYDNTLLIDNLRPALSVKQLKTLEREPVWLRIKVGNELLQVLCLLVEFQCDLHTLAIVRCEFTRDHRWFPRITFPVRSGPKCRLSPPNLLPIWGYVRNLSTNGAMIEFYGDDLRESLSNMREVDTHIRFNELFQLTMVCDIKTLKYMRSPSCHTQLRLKFSRHTDISRHQVDGFIDALREDAAFSNGESKGQYVA